MRSRARRNALTCMVAASLAATPAAGAVAAPAVASGAALVADILPGAMAGDPHHLTALGSTVYFTAEDARHGRELWRSDGTPRGTRLVADIAPGVSASAPQELTEINGTLFFSAWHPKHGRELWSSDGTATGTRLAADLRPGPAGSSPQHVTYGVNTQQAGSVPQTLAYFSADDGAHGRELWRSDGTAAGTTLVADIRPGAAGSDPDGFAVPPGSTGTGTLVMFAADDGGHGRELWRTSGTEASTALRADINPGPAGSSPTFITGGALWAGLPGTFPLAFLSADDGTHGREPVVSFASTGRTSVLDLRPGAQGSDPQGFTEFALEYAAITADDGTRGREPYYLRPGLPVPSGQDTATLIADLNPGPAGSAPREVVFQRRAGAGQLTRPPEIRTGFHRNYLAATSPAGATGLHAVNVETLGPWGHGGGARIEAIDPQPIATSGSNPTSLALAGTTVVYVAAGPAYGRELWRSDGHAANTRQIADINPGAPSSDPRDLTVAGNRVFFSADDGVHGRELWTTVVGLPSLAHIAGPFAPTSTTPSEFTLRATGLTSTANPTGTVTIWEGDRAVATRALPPGGGPITWSTTLTPGPHRLTATYSGDKAFAPSTSTPWLVTVGRRGG